MSVDFIDFSSKHDILLRNPDGSFTPMDEPWFEAEQIDDDTWQVLSSGDYCYVLKGDGEAIAIDCGYGAGNIRKYMEEISGVPVPYVANTHDHFDHTACNAYFDKAYMSVLGTKYATVPYPSFAGIDFHADEYERIGVKEGDVIPVKGRELICISIADHAPTSMLYLDKTHRYLITGDEFFKFPMKPLSRGLKEWVANLQKVKEIWDDFDMALGGNGPLTKEHIKSMIDVAEYALAHPEAAQKREAPGPGAPGTGGRGPKPIPEHDGHMVYDRKMPHAGDYTVYDPEDAPNSKDERKVIVKYNGYEINFDPEA